MEEEGCGVVFSRDEDSDDEYLLIQRHFEEPDDGRPYIETDDENFCGHFHRVRATVSRDRFRVKFGSRIVEVSFSASDDTFDDATKVLRVLIPDIEIVAASVTVRHDGG
jgi:hypothetical protein